MGGFAKYASAVTGFFCRLFDRWGQLVARYPVPFIVLPIIVCSTLSVFFLYADHQSDVEDMYTPRNSRGRADRQRVKELFKDKTGENFNQMSTNDHPLGIGLILQQHNRSNVLTDRAFHVMRDIADQIINITMVIDVDIIVPSTTENVSSLGLSMTPEGLVTSGNYVTSEDYEAENNNTSLPADVKVMTIKRLVTYQDVCARLKGQCQIEGGFILSDEFKEAYENGTLQYPSWDSPWGPEDLQRIVGHPNVTETGQVLDAQAVRMIFHLRRNTEHLKFLSLEWEKHYVDVASGLDAGPLDYAYASSHSLSLEMERGTRGEIRYFILTFVLMISYACTVSAGGDCVSSRALLAGAGVLAAMMGIAGSLGLVSLLGVPFVNIVGTMPFLVLGIGVDDMFLLMAAWSGTLGDRDVTVPKRLGSTFRAAGIGITITSLTDGLAFAVGGATSVFQSVRNFCTYTGSAVMMCFLCNLTLFGGCVALHGRRVYSGRHNVTCRKVRSRQQLKEEGYSSCFGVCCGGSVPEEVGGDESVCEKGPRLFLPRLVLWAPVKVFILVCFAVFLGVSVWGALRLKQGLLLTDLVLPSSFYYKYNTWDEELYGVTFPVSFVIDEPLNYTNLSTATELRRILTKTLEDPDINSLGAYCWLADYLQSVYFDLSSNEAFVRNLKQKFLSEKPHYINDIVFDEENDVILASRCHVFTNDIRESKLQADLMLRLREIADASSIKMFAYQPIFVFFEQYAAIVPNTLLTVSVTLATMFVVSFVLLAHPLMVFLVLFNVAMILTGIFGFMTLWGLTLSSITMIHLIMSIGFSVDFSAHVCAAYITSGERTRQERARYALIHASGPILNGGMSSFIGIVVLVLSESYIFRSFFKIMFLVILFGMLHAVFLMPVILSLIGPELSDDQSDTRESSVTPRDTSLSNGKHASNGKVSTIALSTDSHENVNNKSLDQWLGGPTAYDNETFITHL